MHSTHLDGSEGAILQLFEQAKQTALKERFEELTFPHTLGELHHSYQSDIYDIVARVEGFMRDKVPVSLQVTVRTYKPEDGTFSTECLELFVEGASPRDNFVELSPLRTKEIS